MEVKTLYSTILAKYSYEELKELCLEPDFRLLFDCDWGIWRDKAVADFDISHQFFDLVKNVDQIPGSRALCGRQRYLQISAYVKLSPASLATSCREGVYEATYGFYQAKLRKDKDMIFWFASVAQEKHVENPHKASLEIDEKMRSKSTLFSLRRATKEGRVDILDNIIHDIFNLPENFSIARDMTKEQNCVPLQDMESSEVKDLLKAAFKSGNIRIADFYLCMFRNKETEIREAASKARFGYSSLLLHGKPEDAYNIALRTLPYKCKEEELGQHMIEVALLCTDQPKQEFIIHYMGDVASLSVLLPICNKQDIQETLHELDLWDKHFGSDIYPLSVDLIKHY